MSETQTEPQRTQKPRPSRRKSKTRMTLNEIYDWPWKVDIELFADEKKQIGFMSGQEREYFPEKPGHSRHGVEYSMNCHPGDVPNPSYVPSENRLQKPISNKGYGIGGLSAPRWKGDKQELPRKDSFRMDLEDEEHHDEHRESMKSMGSIVDTSKSIDNGISPKKLAEIKRHQRELKLMGYQETLAPTPDECRQRKLAFGFSTQTSRFSKEKAGCTTPGVGHYDIHNTNQCKRVPVSTTFGMGPIFVHESIFTNCDYEEFDHCVECLIPLISTDYYRTIRPLSIPHNYFINFSTHEDATRPTRVSHPNRSGSSVVMSKSSTSKTTSERTIKNSPPKYIALCRSCYCDIKQLGHEYWTPKRLEGKFMKTRHCVNIHEHNGLPSFVYKVPCKIIQKLKRKEAMMNKNFPDRCEPVIAE